VIPARVDDIANHGTVEYPLCVTGCLSYGFRMRTVVSLTDSEMAVLQAQQTALLTARLDQKDPVRGILLALARLIGAKNSFATATIGGRLVFIKEGVGPQIEAYLAKVFKGFDAAGNALFSDPELEEINRRRREMGAGVHHESRLQMRQIIERTRFFQDVFAPAGMHHVIGMSVPLKLGEAVFAFGFEGDHDPGFIGERSVRLLSLVLPAFSAGFIKADRRADVAAELTAALAQVPNTRTLHRAPKQVANEMVLLPGPALPGHDRTWITAPRQAVKSNNDLRQAAKDYGLTSRQIEVMDLMMNGMPSPQITQHLDISPHTARRHSEAVLKRLGIRSRSAIWSVLNAQAHE